jgi:hypothetical protein
MFERRLEREGAEKGQSLDLNAGFQVVVVSSVAGKIGATVSASYSMSKFALHVCSNLPFMFVQICPLC